MGEHPCLTVRLGVSYQALVLCQWRDGLLSSRATACRCNRLTDLLGSE
jgi:hypothetical protein